MLIFPQKTKFGMDFSSSKSSSKIDFELITFWPKMARFRPLWTVLSHLFVWIRTSWGQFRPFRTNFRPYWTVSIGHNGPFWAISDGSVQFRTVLVHWRLFWNSLDHIKPFRTNLDQFWLISTTFGPFSTFSNRFGAFRSVSERFGAFWTYL